MRSRNMLPAFKSGGVASMIALGVCLVGCGPRSGAGSIDPTNAAQVQRGQMVYNENCSRCHGAQLQGQPEWRVRLPNGRLPAPPHDDTGHTWHHPSAMLFEIVKHGLVSPNAPDGYPSDMPAFATTLRDDDIAAVLSFIRSRWGSEVQKFRIDNKLDVAG